MTIENVEKDVIRLVSNKRESQYNNANQFG